MPVTKLVTLASTPLGALTGGLSLALFSAPAAATLHGYCAPGATQCIDNGTNSPTTKKPTVELWVHDVARTDVRKLVGRYIGTEQRGVESIEGELPNYGHADWDGHARQHVCVVQRDA